VSALRDLRALVDKMILLIDSLRIADPFVFVADAYYATGKIVRGLLATGNHLVTRVKKNAVACARPPAPSVHAPKKRGRPRRYGDKIQVASLLVDDGAMSHGLSPIYGETAVTLRYRAVDLLWRPVGILVRFQLGLVAQGVLQRLAATVPALVWRACGSRLRRGLRHRRSWLIPKLIPKQMDALGSGRTIRH